MSGGISVYIPAGILVLLQGLYWFTACFIFVYQLDASWDPYCGKYYCYYSTEHKNIPAVKGEMETINSNHYKNTNSNLRKR